MSNTKLISKLRSAAWSGPVPCPVCDEAADALEGLQAQLPERMEHCTIVFKECEKGHGRLTATNWVQHDCPTCALEAAQAERSALRAELNKQVALVEKCMLAMNENADRGQKAEAERDLALAQIVKMQKQEPIGDVVISTDILGGGGVQVIKWRKDAPPTIEGMKVYAAAGASQVQPAVDRLVDAVLDLAIPEGGDVSDIGALPSHAAAKAARSLPWQRWKSGNDFAPFHPQASHVSPDYRDGWNDAYAAACAQQPSWQPSQARELSNTEVDEIVYACRRAGDDSTYALTRAIIAAINAKG